MRKYLTIGELADLMKISTSSIRYYEKEGLLSPFKIDDNGYRLYDFNELDRLETILLLRKLDIPLKNLKNIITGYSTDDYVEILQSSLLSIDSQIDQLKNKKSYINKKLNFVHNFKKNNRCYHLIHLPERVFLSIHTGKIFDYTIKEIYEFMKSKNLSWLNTLYDNYIVSVDKDIFSLCILETTDMKVFEASDKIILPAGTYLNYGFFIEYSDNMDAKIEVEIANFYDYMKKNNLSAAGKLLSIENIKCWEFNTNSIYLELQILIRT